MAEHKDGPDPQRTPGGEEHDAKPAKGIPVQRPEPLAIGVGRQIASQQADQREDDEDPAVATILALARAQVAATEERYASQDEECDRQGDPGRVCEEGRRSTPSEDSEAEVGQGPDDGDSCQSGGGRHGLIA
jgi:hypothetical protein